MKLIGLLLIPIIVSHILLSIKNYNIKKEQTENTNRFIVRLPKAFFFIGFTGEICCYTVFLTVLFLVKETSRIWILSAVLLVSLLVLFLIFACVFFRIIVVKEEQHFEYHTSFGKCYRINYADCQYEISENALHLYTDKHFIVDPYCVNFDIFIKILKKRSQSVNQSSISGRFQ